jgi:hypothetical protein
LVHKIRVDTCAGHHSPEQTPDTWGWRLASFVDDGVRSKRVRLRKWIKGPTVYSSLVIETLFHVFYHVSCPHIPRLRPRVMGSCFSVPYTFLLYFYHVEMSIWINPNWLVYIV